MLLRGIESEIADGGPFLSLCSEAGHSVSSLPSFPWALLLRRNLGPGTPSSAGTLNNTETDTLPPSRLARRGGVKRISAGIYDEIRGSLKARLELVCPHPLPQSSTNSPTRTHIDLV